MPGPRSMLPALLAAFVAAAPAAADAEEAARKIWSDYLGLRNEKGFKAQDRRFDILRDLGRHDCDTARQALLKVARMSRSDDERVLAVLSLGRIADLGAAQALVAAVERKPEPAVAQALAEALATTIRPEVLAWLAGDALDTSRPEVLRACLEALAALEAPSALPKVLEIYEESRDVAVLHEAVRAMGRFGGAEARAPLLAATAHPEWQVRLAAAEVLPALAAGDEEVLAALRVLLTDSATRVRRAAASAAAEAKLEAVVPDLIELLGQDPRLRTREVARQALKRISGRDFEHDGAAWREWWRTRGDDTTTLGEPERRITFAQYYGVSVLSDRVLFIVDVSGSMSWPWRREPKRIEVARNELERVIGELRPESLFNIVLFSTRVHAWRKSEVDADPRNVKSALSWVEKKVRDPDGDTYAFDALEEAFEHNPEFDTIYFLSDGQPSDGAYISPEGIVASVKVWNRHRGAVIHTIGLTLENLDRGLPNLAEDLQLMKRFVKQLAHGTGGECRVVTMPPVR